ncbi:MAG: threonine--tRNA ligase [Candidatus Glassbacteria bacterium]|nr:threonine--tRNA ligase [Candidatus Glassbacteria bacterium]
MRILMLHTDEFSYHVTEKTGAVGKGHELEPELQQGETGEALVVFCCSEKGDEKGVESVAGQVAGIAAGHARRVKTDTVMVYPYAHLSSNLASPRIATKVLDRIYELLGKEDGLAVKRSPFGYYKAFTVKCKGHPLSELAQTIVPETGKKKKADDSESEALKGEKKLESEWYIAEPGKELVPTEEYNFKQRKNLRKLYSYESDKDRTVVEPPAHIELMKRLELVDYEPGSDPGNFRWYPKGQLIKQLCEELVSDLTADYGGMRVETPIMYDYQHPKLSSYLNRFPARQYVLLSEDKEYFLRFAACFGQYMIQHDMQLSYRHLPCHLYELTHYSFRREQTGELAGLKRLRTFTMPDMHTLARDMEQAKQEFAAQIDLCKQCMDAFELDYEVAIRFVKDFREDNKEFAEQLIELVRQPSLVELWNKRFFYFVTKLEFNFIDAQDKASCLSTIQIDVENCERFEIEFIDEDGQAKFPLLLHTSISGSIDRVMYAMLENQAIRMNKGIKAELPLWLAPTQLRLISVGEQFHEYCEQLMKQIPFRVDFDDRDMTVGKKIRETEREWVPFAAVIGQREVEASSMSIRTRSTGEQTMMTPAELTELIKGKTAKKPFRKLNVPARLSKRPIFVG